MLTKRIIDMTSDELITLIKDATLDAIGTIPTKNADEILLNRNEVAKMLKCSTQAVDQWKKQGKLKFKRIGNRIFFVKSEVFESLKTANIKCKLEV